MRVKSAGFILMQREEGKQEAEAEIRNQKLEIRKQTEDGSAFHRDRGILEKKNGAGERS